MNVYTHLERLEKLTDLAELIQTADRRVENLKQLENDFNNLGYPFNEPTDFYEKRIESTKAAKQRIESRYRHLVAELNAL